MWFCCDFLFVVTKEWKFCYLNVLYARIYSLKGTKLSKEMKMITKTRMHVWNKDSRYSGHSAKAAEGLSGKYITHCQHHQIWKSIKVHVCWPYWLQCSLCCRRGNGDNSWAKQPGWFLLKKKVKQSFNSNCCSICNVLDNNGN